MAARCILLIAAAAGVGAQLLMPWSNDNEDTTFGPDGPWQAIDVKLDGAQQQQQQVPLWPGGSGVSEIPTVEINGHYSITGSAIKTGSSRAASDSWMSSFFTEAFWSGSEYWNGMVLEPRLGNSRDIKVRATLVAATNWTSGAPLNETNYKPSVGILGLGPQRERIDGTTDPSILDQLKTSGDIERNAFSVHMGSAALKLPGSLVLGGYEQNRALGQVGAFTLFESSVPIMYLRDLFMDVELGTPTSYPRRSNGSFWQESTEQGQRITKNADGPAGSVVVIPNPASPYIYLPPGFCEGVAANLNMVLHEPTGLYLWGSDPRAEIFVNSSAYLGFVLSDQSRTNLTIKVPFKLLNLTLEPPLVDQPVNYFPCKSLNSATGFWQLGRAFLQAAFLAVDYDGDVAYMAQAPGPDIEQSVMRKFDDSTITTNPEESFSSTWRSSWNPVYMSRTSDTGDTGLQAEARLAWPLQWWW